MSLTGMIAYACSAIIAAAAGFHLYWGVGGRIGLDVSVPHGEDGEPLLNPGRAGAAIVGVLLLLALVAVVAQAGIIELPVSAQWLRAFVGLLALAFTIRALVWHRHVGFFKSVRHTKFARNDTWFYTPLCLFLGAALFYQVA
jgi:Protein of unknown function (DUF3995)